MRAGIQSADDDDSPECRAADLLSRNRQMEGNRRQMKTKSSVDVFTCRPKKEYPIKLFSIFEEYEF